MSNRKPHEFRVKDKLEVADAMKPPAHLSKEIQYQDVGIKDTSIFKPYKINNTHINGTKQTKAFYYLIVKLSDDKYLRYVNCSKEDFHGLNTGDNVLVVYYGNNNLRGYKV